MSKSMSIRLVQTSKQRTPCHTISVSLLLIYSSDAVHVPVHVCRCVKDGSTLSVGQQRPGWKMMFSPLSTCFLCLYISGNKRSWSVIRSHYLVSSLQNGWRIIQIFRDPQPVSLLPSLKPDSTKLWSNSNAVNLLWLSFSACYLRTLW